jgi:hypothetical protein
VCRSRRKRKERESVWRGVGIGKERERRGCQIMRNKKLYNSESSHPRLDLLLDELDEAPAVSLMFFGLFKEGPMKSLKSQLPKMGVCLYVQYILMITVHVSACALCFSKGSVFLGYYSNTYNHECKW